MVHIWRALVDDPKKTIDLHFQSIMRELLREMGGRLWRNRQAACAALADLLQGRRFAELAPHLEEVWTMTLRCLDDIKETVRAQSMALVRCVRSLTLRLVDPQFTSKAECAQAVGLLLPLLLEKGLGSSVQDVKAIALDAVAKTVKLSTAEALKPQLVPLVEAMLEGLSSLEDARLNYVEQVGVCC
jgi:proteasome component ECM29